MEGVGRGGGYLEEGRWKRWVFTVLFVLLLFEKVHTICQPLVVVVPRHASDASVTIS